jgi:hypothetical protein
MIFVELSKKDLETGTRTQVRNPPGMLFGGTSPLLRPFMKKLEEPAARGEKRARRELHSHHAILTHRLCPR